MRKVDRWILEWVWHVALGPRIWWRTRRWSLLIPALPVLLAGACTLGIAVLLCVESSQNLAERYLKTLRATGPRERAFELWVAKLQQLAPGNPEVRFAAGRLAAFQGDRLRALEWIRPLAPLTGRGYPPAHLWMAAAILRRETEHNAALPQQAARKLQRHLERSDVASRSARWLFGQLGLRQFAQGRIRQSIRNLRHAVGVVPVARFVLSEAYQRVGNEPAALRELKRARDACFRRTESHPHDVRSWCYWAYACERLGKTEQAISILEQRGRVTQNVAYDRAAAAVCLRQYDRLWTSPQSHLIARIALLERASRLAPGDSRVVHRLISFISCADRIGVSARAEIYQALATGRATATTHLLLGSVALQDAKYRVAQTHLEQALRRNPQAPVILNNLAWLLMQDHPPQWLRARELLDMALRGSPDDPEILATRGDLLGRMGQWDAAVEDLERSLSICAETPRLHGMLADAYQMLGDTELERIHRSLEAKQGLKP